MTREEYIDFANALKNNYTIDFDKLPEFCDMAISALEDKTIEREMIEAIINKCEEDKKACCDIAGTKEAEEDAIVYSYASEIIDFAKDMLKEFEGVSE